MYLNCTLNFSLVLPLSTSLVISKTKRLVIGINPRPSPSAGRRPARWSLFCTASKTPLTFLQRKRSSSMVPLSQSRWTVQPAHCLSSSTERKYRAPFRASMCRSTSECQCGAKGPLPPSPSSAFLRRPLLLWHARHTRWSKEKLDGWQDDQVCSFLVQFNSLD